MSTPPRPGRRPPPPSGPASERDSEVYTAAHVESEILRLNREMDKGLTELIAAAQRAADAEHAYKVKFAQAKLARKAKGDGYGPSGRVTDDDAESHAIGQCDEELREHLIAAAMERVHMEKQRSLRSQIDSLRTIAANIRAMT